MPEENHYQSPQNASARNGGRSLLSWVLRAIPWAVVVGLLLWSLGMVSYMQELRSRYPNLEDHSPGVDWYWPEVYHLIAGIWASILVAIALLIAVIAFLWQRRVS
jgi:hypothetical protein